MEETTSVTSLDIQEKTFYVKLNWKPNENELFHITIYDGEATWIGRYSNEFAKKYSEIFLETPEDYYANLKKGLVINNEFKYDFAVQKDDKDSATFSWKKKIEDPIHGPTIVVNGAVPVHRSEINESKDTLLDFLLAENRKLKITFDALVEKNKELTKDLDKCEADLMKFVDIKTELETSLYGKFVQLLNAKKKRIQLLEENLSKLSKSDQSGDELD